MQARHKARGKAFQSVLRCAVQQLEEQCGSGSTRDLTSLLWALARLSPGAPMQQFAALCAQVEGALVYQEGGKQAPNDHLQTCP